MPNPFHLRANIDRLWRRSADHNAGYVRVAALDAIVRELYAPNDRARANHELYLVTDPFDVARHKLRDLYDRAPVPVSHGNPLGSPQEDELAVEDDDPL